jgi:hypothetical protein
VQVSSLIKATNMYRVSKYRDIALDYLPPTEDEVKTFHESHIRHVFFLHLLQCNVQKKSSTIICHFSAQVF